jgi:hypothetical protein
MFPCNVVHITTAVDYHCPLTQWTSPRNFREFLQIIENCAYEYMRLCG